MARDAATGALRRRLHICENTRPRLVLGEVFFKMGIPRMFLNPTTTAQPGMGSAYVPVASVMCSVMSRPVIGETLTATTGRVWDMEVMVRPKLRRGESELGRKWDMPFGLGNSEEREEEEDAFYQANFLQNFEFEYVSTRTLGLLPFEDKTKSYEERVEFTLAEGGLQGEC